MPRPLIAIVDDEPSILRALKRIVEANGLCAQTYSSGEELLCSCLDEVECVVLDINLTGISGIETKRRLALIDSGLPVIFMTALNSAIVQEEALNAGCSAFLHKPFSGHRLVDAVHEALAKSDA
jgi:FixJ family two-component response regulator